jgi:hypothetical protein
MRPSPFEEATEGGRHHGEARRHAHERALLDTRPERPSAWARLEAAILNLVRRDHSLTDYPCRLSNGKIGRTAVVMSGGEWTLVCRTT